MNNLSIFKRSTSPSNEQKGHGSELGWNAWGDESSWGTSALSKLSMLREQVTTSLFGASTSFDTLADQTSEVRLGPPRERGVSDVRSEEVSLATPSHSHGFSADSLSALRAGILQQLDGVQASSSEAQNGDFMSTIEIPAEPRPDGGTDVLPPNHVSFVALSPLLFACLRHSYNISDSEYAAAFQDNVPFIELKPATSKSGRCFFRTHDNYFILKSLVRSEASFLLEILYSYYEHVLMYPHTLLPRHCGLYSLVDKGREMLFLVEANHFGSQCAIHERYDLKGSVVGRLTSQEDRHGVDPILKDLDLKHKVHLGVSRRQMLLTQLKQDCNFLENHEIVDYSLLLGVHHTILHSKQQSDSHQPSGHYTATDNPQPESSKHQDAPTGGVKAGDEACATTPPHLACNLAREGEGGGAERSVVGGDGETAASGGSSEGAAEGEQPASTNSARCDVEGSGSASEQHTTSSNDVSTSAAERDTAEGQSTPVDTSSGGDVQSKECSLNEDVGAEEKDTDEDGGKEGKGQHEQSLELDRIEWEVEEWKRVRCLVCSDFDEKITFNPDKVLVVVVGQGDRKCADLCRGAARLIDDMAESDVEMQQLSLLVLDLDECSSHLVSSLQVFNLPTLLCFRAGEERARAVGCPTKRAVHELVVSLSSDHSNTARKGVRGKRDAPAHAPQPTAAVGPSVSVFRKNSNGILGDKADIYYFGIVDVLQPYNFKKQLEHSLKALVQDKNKMTIVEPALYSQRFQAFISSIVE